MHSFLSTYNRIFAHFNILDFNYQWFKWGSLFHDKLPMFSLKGYRGVFLQLVRHLYFLLRFFFVKAVKISKADIIAFYETSNQKKAIINVCEHIKKSQQLRLLVIDGLNRSENSKDIVLVSFSFLDVVFGSVYGLLNCYKIIDELNKIDNRLSKNQLSDFLSTYAWVSYFLRILIISRPSCVILSNDHNPSNRSLIAACNVLNIKTIYIQHASITRFMPPICCDLNFLYGHATKDLYEQIGSKDDSLSHFTKKHYEIILSGIQKNSNNTFRGNIKTKEAIGIAVNHDDPILSIKNLIDKLSESYESSIILRFHPSQGKDSIKRIFDTFKHYKNVVITSPHEMSLAAFFSEVKLVIAGNSGILLDSIINKLPTFYFRFDRNSFDDFYCFVKFKLITELSIEDISNKNFQTDVFNQLNIRDIQYFDNSYNNNLSFKETEFISNTIINRYFN